MDYKKFYKVAGVDTFVVSNLHLSKVTNGFAVRRMSDCVNITVYTSEWRAQNLCEYLNDLANYGIQGVNSHR